jgi:hypothetical protein
MSIKNTAFYLKKKRVSFNFSAKEISSDGGCSLLFKLARNSKLIKHFCKYMPDRRNSGRVIHDLEALVLQRVLLLSCGYEDSNDLDYLKKDPLLNEFFEQGVCSQPTMSRLENSLNIGDLYRMAVGWIDNYVGSLPADKEYVIIDVDCTDDPTHGDQQGSLFHGYYWQWMLNELFYIDGETGQIILPVLRPGNVHSSRWNARFLSIIVSKLRERFPDIQIITRADAGFSTPEFYDTAQQDVIDFCIGISSNQRLQGLIKEHYSRVEEQYAKHGIKHQEFVGPVSYQADSWTCPQEVYAKIESTGQGMNVRFYVSNFEDEDAQELYKDFYVQRGEASENRIKEIKNMCFSDRLSCHRFSANYFRLMLSSLAYELLRQLRELIRMTSHEKAKRWSIQSIRLYLLKVAAQVQQSVRQIHICFSRSFSQQNLFTELMMLC